MYYLCVGRVLFGVVFDRDGVCKGGVYKERVQYKERICKEGVREGGFELVT